MRRFPALIALAAMLVAFPVVGQAQTNRSCLTIVNHRPSLVVIKVKGYDGYHWTIRPNNDPGTILTWNGTDPQSNLHAAEWTIWEYLGSENGPNITGSATWSFDADRTDHGYCDGTWVATIN